MASALLQSAVQGKNAMLYDLIVILLLAVAVPVIALVTFLSMAKTKRHRRPVKNFR
jgi:heme/copper-type cytochrome/quinol oxidase subunit 4